MKKKELVKELSDINELSQSESRQLLDSFLKELTDILRQGNSYHEKDFGTFKSMYHKSRIGFHPILKQKISLPQKRKIRFIPSIDFKKIINE